MKPLWSSSETLGPNTATTEVLLSSPPGQRPVTRGTRVLGLGLRVEGLGFKVWGLGLRVERLGFKVWGLGLRVEGLGGRVQGLRV